MKIEFFPPGPRSWKPQWPLPLYRIVSLVLVLVGGAALIFSMGVEEVGVHRTTAIGGPCLMFVGIAIKIFFKRRN